MRAKCEYCHVREARYSHYAHDVPGKQEHLCKFCYARWNSAEAPLASVNIFSVERPNGQKLDVFPCYGPGIDCPRLLNGRYFVIHGKAVAGCLGPERCSFNQKEKMRVFESEKSGFGSLGPKTGFPVFSFEMGRPKPPILLTSDMGPFRFFAPHGRKEARGRAVKIEKEAILRVMGLSW